MANYKSVFDIHQSFNDTISAIDDFHLFSKQKVDSNDCNDEQIAFIKEQFEIILLQTPPDSSNTFKILTEIIFSHPNVCIQFILPAHVEKAIFLISKKDYCQNAIIFLNSILSTYPQISQNDTFCKLSQNLFDNMAPFFSSKVMNENIKCFQNIISKSIYDSTTLDVFIKSQSMKEIKNHILNSIDIFEEEDQDYSKDILIVSLEIIKILCHIHPIPESFAELVYPLQVISTQNGKESILSLQILTDLTLYSSIDVLNYIKLYEENATYIDPLSSFLGSNQEMEKRISSFQLLAALSKYKDDIFEEMNHYSVLFRAREALMDQKNEVIYAALNFFLSWLLFANKYRTQLFDQICKFNLIEVCKRSTYQVKNCLIDLILFLSQNASVEQLTNLINQPFLHIVMDSIDDADIELSLNIFRFLQFIVGKPQTDFLQMVKNELVDIQVDEPLLNQELYYLLELINKS